MKTPKWNTKHGPGLSRILKEAGAVRQAKPGHMHVLRACLKMSLLIGTEFQEDQWFHLSLKTTLKLIVLSR